jgi:hypothetical protein
MESSHLMDVVKTAGKSGMKIVMIMVFMALAFLGINLVLWIWGVAHYVGSPKAQWYHLLLMALVSLGSTAMALYFTYHYMLISSIKAAYDLFQPAVRLVVNQVVDKSENLIAADGFVNKKLVNTPLVSGILSKTYGRLPSFLHRGIAFVLNKAPLVEPFKELQLNLSNENKEQAGDIFFSRINETLNDTVFEDNNLHFLWWLIPLNIGLFVAILKFLF